MSQRATWVKFIVVGIELASCILAGIFIGSEADEYFDKQPLFTIIGVIVGLIAGFTLMLKIINTKKR